VEQVVAPVVVNHDMRHNLLHNLLHNRKYDESHIKKPISLRIKLRLTGLYGCLFAASASATAFFATHIICD